MSFLRALRAYVGLGPDEDIEDRYLYELNSRRRELDLDELEPDLEIPADDDDLRLDLESDDVVIVTPGSGGRAGSRPVGTGAHSVGRHDRPPDLDLRFEFRRSVRLRRTRSGRADRRDNRSRPLDRERGRGGGAVRGTGPVLPANRRRPRTTRSSTSSTTIRSPSTSRPDRRRWMPTERGHRPPPAER